jgi:hypothetical protein
MHGRSRRRTGKQPEAGLHVSMQTFLLLVWPGRQARHGLGHGMAGAADSGSNPWAVSDSF